MKNLTKQKLPSPFELLEEAFRIYSKKLWIFLGIIAMPVLLNLIFIPLLAYSSKSGSGIRIIPILLTIFTTILSIVASAWSYLAIIYAIREKNPAILKAYYASKTKLLGYIFINILTAIATIPGIILLGIPTIIYLVWFAFSGFVLVTENHRGSNALMRSREYVTGKWWKVAWRFLFIILPLFAIQYAGSTLANFTNFFLAHTFFPAGSTILVSTIAATVLALFGGIVTIITLPLSISYSYRLYLNLRKIKPELAKKPVNEKYKWFFILSPTTILIIAITLIGLLLKVASGI